MFEFEEFHRIIMVLLKVKSGLYAKDESCSFKIKQDMAVFVQQGDAKSEFHQILKYKNLSQFQR